MERTLFTAEHEAFRADIRDFIATQIVPHQQTWQAEGMVPAEIWRKAGAAGYLCMDVPEAYGGRGQTDFRYPAILIEELAYANCAAPDFSVHSDIVVPYITRYGSAEQKQRWLPDLVSGQRLSAIAMTEANAGSDLVAIQSQASDHGDYYCLNGSKTFITGGLQADLIIVACKTAPERKLWGMSLLVVEGDMLGFKRGRRLEKVGWRAQDMAELFFDEVHIPKTNVIGQPGQGYFLMRSMLAQERLIIAIGSIAGARAALNWTMDYCKQQDAQGDQAREAQHRRFLMAEMATEITIGQAFIDRCIVAHDAGQLSDTEAAMAKWWASDLQKRVVGQCVTLHGDEGYLAESPIAQAWLDMRWRPIGGGTNEILKEMIGQSLGF